MNTDTTEKSEKKLSDQTVKPVSDIKTYIENRIELFSLTIAEQIASVISASIQKFIGMLFLSAGAVFLWIALGFFLGELLDSQGLGFLIASLPLLILGVILYSRSARNLDEKIHTDIVKKISVNFDQIKESGSAGRKENE